MKCPVCDNVQTSLVCPKCGFDSSRDYAKYPTLGPLDRVPSLSALRADWAQKQQESLAEPVSPVPDPAEEPVILSPGPDPAEESVILSSAPEPIGEPPQKKKPWLVIAACTAIAAIILVLIVITGGFAPRSPIALTVGGTKVSAAELNHYYIDSVNNFLNSYGDYVSLFGLDTTRALDEQFYNEAEGDTWSDYFLDHATATAQNMYAVYNAAKADGFTMSEDAKASVDATVENMKHYAATHGFPSADAYIAAMYGEGCNEKTFRQYTEVQMTAQEYIAAKNESLTYDEAAIRAEEEENFDAYSFYPLTELVNVRHILVSYEGGTTDEVTGTTTYSDEEKAAAKAKAQEILDAFNAGEKTEEAFAALATEKTTDTSSRENGGLYENVYPGQMVSAFNDWCFDATRKTGDVGLVGTEYGCHVMYFVGYSGITYRDLMIESALRSEDMTAWENSLIEASELVVADTQYIKTDLIIHGNWILPPGYYPFGAIHRPAIP